MIRCRLASILSRGASVHCPLFLKGSKSAVHAHRTPTPWAGLSPRGSPAGQPHRRCQVNSYHSYLASDISVTSTTDLPHGPHPTSSQGPAEAVTAPPHGHTSRGPPWPPRCTATSAGEQALPSGWPGPCPPVSPDVCPSQRPSSLFSVLQNQRAGFRLQAFGERLGQIPTSSNPTSGGLQRPSAQGDPGPG